MPENKARNVLVFRSLDDFKRLFSKDDFTCPATVGYVYVVEIGNEIKIGLTSKLWTRLSTLESYARLYMRKEFGRIAFTEPIENYKFLEKHLHLTFWNKRLHGELFNITFENAVNALEQVKAEPYPIEADEETVRQRKARTNTNARGTAARLRQTLKQLFPEGN